MLTYFPAMVAYVRARLGGLRAREEGVTAVEYALMVAIIALLLVGAFMALYQTVKDRYEIVGNCVDTAPRPEYCAPPP